MEKNYTISIVGTQTYTDHKETLELTGLASYNEIRGVKYIRYREYDPDDLNAFITNIIKIESPEKITHVKTGMGNYSHLTLEVGKRHQNIYTSPIGTLSIGIYTEFLSHNVSADGGNIEIDYTVDFNADLQSENHLEITLTKKGDNENV